MMKLDLDVNEPRCCIKTSLELKKFILIQCYEGKIVGSPGILQNIVLKKLAKNKYNQP